MVGVRRLAGIPLPAVAVGAPGVSVPDDRLDAEALGHLAVIRRQPRRDRVANAAIRGIASIQRPIQSAPVVVVRLLIDAEPRSAVVGPVIRRADQVAEGFQARLVDRVADHVGLPRLGGVDLRRERIVAGRAGHGVCRVGLEQRQRRGTGGAAAVGTALADLGRVARLLIIGRVGGSIPRTHRRRSGIVHRRSIIGLLRHGPRGITHRQNNC